MTILFCQLPIANCSLFPLISLLPTVPAALMLDKHLQAQSFFLYHEFSVYIHTSFSYTSRKVRRVAVFQVLRGIGFLKDG